MKNRRWKKRYTLAIALAITALISVGCYLGPTDSWEDVVEYIRPSVVKVIVGDVDQDTKIPYIIGTGSGFLVSSDGLIVTAGHVVVDRAHFKPWIKVQFYDGTEKVAQWKKADYPRDIAVLKIKGDYLEHLRFAKEDVREGQPILAMGSNQISDWAVTDGIVSKSEMFYDPDLGHGWMQSTAPLNPGFSGGPVVNAEGEIVGMSVAYMTQQNEVYLFARGLVIQKTVKRLLKGTK